MLRYVFSFLLIVPTSLLAAEGQKMSKSELHSTLIGHSYPLGGDNLSSSKGAFYFKNKRELEIVWEGKRGQGTWKADDNSNFCYVQSLWPGEECITLLKDGGDFIHVFGGQARKIPAGAIAKGNMLK